MASKDIWVISDTHFNHANILNFEDKDGKKFRGDKFKSLTDMNEEMIYHWNKMVKPQDKIYHLGDVYFGNQGEADKILSRLTGHKRLILGNHDKGKDSVLQKHFEKIDVWRVMKDFKLLFSHVPIHPDNLTIGMHKNSEGNGERRLTGFTNVHGHIHQNAAPKGPYKCVCVEHTEYKPVHIDELLYL